MMVPHLNYEVNVAVLKSTAIPKMGYTHFGRIELGQLGRDEAMERFGVLRDLFQAPLYQLALKKVECFAVRIAETNEQGDIV